MPQPEIAELVRPDLQRELSRYESSRITFRWREKPIGRKELPKWVQEAPGPRLLILNTVQSAAVIAADMAAEFGQTHVEHLSTALTPEDRGNTIDRIRRRLADPDDADWTLVATSCVEAGVDFSFRTGFREISSLLSLLQAAGRVNRHRLRPCGDAPNIAVPQFNWRHCRNRDRGEPYVPAFCWPGYEGKGKERYSIHDLAQILPWREGRLVITADVRLGEDCRLARRDDKSIAKRLFPYFGPEASEYSFVAERSPAALLSEWVYNETPLRNRMGRTETWRLGRDAERLGDVYEAFVYQGERRGSGGQWVERDERSFREVDALPNAWLWLDAETMRAQCEAVGMDEERALSAELVSYSDTDRWEYDKGFGIVRRPAAG